MSFTEKGEQVELVGHGMPKSICIEYERCLLLRTH